MTNKRLSFKFFSTCIISLSFISHAHAAINKAGAEIDWGYKGKRGPDNWGQLDPSFKQCTLGKFQSPIDIPQEVKSQLNTLKINYQKAPLIMIEEGKTDLMIGDTQTIIEDEGIQVDFPEKGVKETIEFNHNSYHLKQFHFHTPSENRLNGKRSPMEIHFVHQGDNGQLAVIGVFVEEGSKNPIIQKIINNLSKVKEGERLILNENINPIALLPRNQKHYTFAGSLTTPPCSEGVNWIVMAEPISASAEQIKRMSKSVDGMNARPLQPINDREIHVHK